VHRRSPEPFGSRLLEAKSADANPTAGAGVSVLAGTRTRSVHRNAPNHVARAASGIGATDLDRQRQATGLATPEAAQYQGAAVAARCKCQNRLDARPETYLNTRP
jgi:hypothetical protein